jgi:hypothetical protein
MSKPYSYSKKKKLADMISKLKKKEDMINIVNIINENNVKITENQNGLYLFFDKLEDSTYYKIENYLESIKKGPITSSEYVSETSSDKKNYTSYCNDDQNNSQDIRYTSKERNIIKRQRYENIINDIKN